MVLRAIGYEREKEMKKRMKEGRKKGMEGTKEGRILPNTIHQNRNVFENSLSLNK